MKHQKWVQVIQLFFCKVLPKLSEMASIAILSYPSDCELIKNGITSVFILILFLNKKFLILFTVLACVESAHIRNFLSRTGSL